jgi:hypothetical protein
MGPAGSVLPGVLRDAGRALTTKCTKSTKKRRAEEGERDDFAGIPLCVLGASARRFPVPFDGKRTK